MNLRKNGVRASTIEFSRRSDCIDGEKVDSV